MKFPSYILLDINKSSNKFTSSYWISKFLIFKNEKNLINFLFNPEFLLRKNKNFINKRSALVSIKNVTFINYSNSWLKNFNIIFLRKEKMYTKLKYSRVPQYDIVSGGVAAIFAGFLGFLICEKFGFELIDSGDFYFVFMYVVFLCYFIRLFVKLFSINTYLWNPVSPKWLINYILTIFSFILKKIKKLINK